MGKTKNLGLQTYSDSDFQTIKVIEWMKSENSDSPTSNMEIIDGAIGTLRLERRKAIAVRVRSPEKPDYGLGGGGDEEEIALNLTDFTGNARYSLLVSGKEYDTNNISADSESAQNGTFIIRKSEE